MKCKFLSLEFKGLCFDTAPVYLSSPFFHYLMLQSSGITQCFSSVPTFHSIACALGSLPLPGTLSSLFSFHHWCPLLSLSSHSTLCLKIISHHYQNSNGIFYRTRTNNSQICMEPQRIPNGHGNLEKEEESWRYHSLISNYTTKL